ncbi:dethiobiotin synthase [Rheinheimera nanhaiensis]|uniref:ATP-dependent dethiobiotin synthetase BioD n=1 Tax=Rheinheimera nanhaiensis E407-8 TaxID=562729 RepID=I1DYH9_9GAMM|nr:dethiobiotin synthase [Rheinheimera nanhaiensis]GAB59107.1 dethiobiotin synthetase [Rheinheimera nanhaiensis E407-8]
MPAKTLFITATDTDAGKSYISAMLLQGFKALDVTAIGVKPIAAGADAKGFNGDALLLQQHSGIALPYKVVNPICYQAPVAPHLAALNEQQPIDEKLLNDALQHWQNLKAEQLLIEGAGGWLLPLSAKRYLADWVAEQQLPVLLVVGMKLGCLNHAMLTVREIERSGCQLIGWVANCIDPHMLLLEQNIADLRQRISAPCLAVVPYAAEPALYQQLAKQIAVSLL